MRISNVKATLKQIIESNALKSRHNDKQVPYLTSKPGVGKSSVVEQTARELEIGYIEFRPANHGIEDLIGLPRFTESADGMVTSGFATPNWLPNAERDGEIGILFLDEIPQSSKAMINGLSQLLLDGKIHDYTLPPKWTIVAAGNRTQDRANANRMPSHVTNRLTPEIEVIFNPDDWMKWAVGAGVRSELVSWVKFDPTVVDSFDPDQALNCTPRSAVKCSDLLDFDSSVRHELFEGTIGKAHAAKLAGYLEVWSQLPDIDMLLKAPKTTPVPGNDRRDLQYAVTFAVASRIDAKNFGNGMDFIFRLPPELQACFVKACMSKNCGIEDHPAFIDYLDKNMDLII